MAKKRKTKIPKGFPATVFVYVENEGTADEYKMVEFPGDFDPNDLAHGQRVGVYGLVDTKAVVKTAELVLP